jgi:hypothetical protein
MIATVTPLERKEHPPAFTCGSPDFKNYAVSKLVTQNLRENQTLLSSIVLIA